MNRKVNIVIHVILVGLSLNQVSCGDEFEEKLNQFGSAAEALRSCIADDCMRLSEKREKHLKIEQKEISAIQDKIGRMVDAYSTYFPGDLIYIMPVFDQIQSEASAKVLSECVYGHVQSEAMHINRVMIHGSFDKKKAGEIIRERIRMLLSMYPISESVVDSESFSLVRILCFYAKFDEDLTKEILLKNIESLEGSVRLPILVFMSRLGDENSTKKLAQFDKKKVDRLVTLYTVFRQDEKMNPR